jgi:hypothetical protein
VKRCYKCNAAESSAAGLCARCSTNRSAWESYVLPEGERRPRAYGRRASGWQWVCNVLLWAFLIVGAAMLGMMVGDDMDREYILRSRLIRQEVR